MLRAFSVALVWIGFATGTFGAERKLNHPKRFVAWTGLVTKARVPIREVPECEPGCQRFDVTVDLPAGIWKNRTGGVQIAIRWAGLTSAMPPTASFATAGRPTAQSTDPTNLGDNLKLYVYRGEYLIA